MVIVVVARKLAADFAGGVGLTGSTALVGFAGSAGRVNSGPKAFSALSRSVAAAEIAAVSIAWAANFVSGDDPGGAAIFRSALALATAA